MRSKIWLADITSDNIKQLERLNLIIFPISFNKNFYKYALEAGELAKLAYYGDTVVGTLCCRIDLEGNTRRLYIMTLGCLYPYRRLGIGTTMMQHVLNNVQKDDADFDSIYLHVQVNNDGAVEFYKKFGFKIAVKKERYYRRIEPTDAYILQKNLKQASTAQGDHAS